MSTFAHSRLTILTFESLLREQGWQIDRTNDQRAIWTRDDAGIFLPQQVDSNFDLLMSRAIGVLQDHEATNIDVGWHLEWPGWDRLQSRIAGESWIGLKASLDKQQALFDIIESIAWSRATPDKQSFRGGNRPRSVRDYIGASRAVPSVQGSFIMRAILPLYESNQSSMLEHQRFRDFTVAIPTVLSTASIAANDVLRHGAPLDRWDEAFERAGVTANLLDALVRHVEADKGIHPNTTVDISLTYSVEKRLTADTHQSVQMPVYIRDVLEVGSSHLRRAPEQQTLRSIGLVTKLERQKKIGAGHVTVTGSIEGWDTRHRSLRFELDEESYSEAVHAHESGRQVSARVVAVRKRTRIEVAHVIEFYAMQQDEVAPEQRPHTLFG